MVLERQAISLGFCACANFHACACTGLGIRAQNATIDVEDGFATQTYWLTDLKGRKVRWCPSLSLSALI